MPLGAILGLKKMLTSPFGPLILFAIPALTIIGFYWIDNNKLEKSIDQYRERAAQITVARDIAEREGKTLRSDINKITSDLISKEKEISEIQTNAKSEAKNVLIEYEKEATVQLELNKNSKEMTEWYQEVWD